VARQTVGATIVSISGSECSRPWIIQPCQATRRKEITIKIAYYYDRNTTGTAEGKAKHERICSLLSDLELASRIDGFTIQERQEVFSTKEAEKEILERLKDFSLRHHVKLRRIFGSNRYGFSYLPPEFLFVYEDGELREVFPCEIERTYLDVLGFLERVVKGEAWTVHSTVRRKERGKHKELVDHIAKNPDVLEPGLRLCGSNVHVSREFGEVGYVDLVFIGEDGTYLLVEVKIKPEEIDKAIGQILRHRSLFASQNFLQPEKIRMAIACPFIPSQSRKICEEAQIQCFEIKNV
jgi:hypothetical protein